MASARFDYAKAEGLVLELLEAQVLGRMIEECRENPGLLHLPYARYRQYRADRRITLFNRGKFPGLVVFQQNLLPVQRNGFDA